MSNYLIIIACVVMIAFGQLMFKTVGTKLGASGFEALLTDYKAAGIFVSALALYGIATIGWVLALRNVPLSTAYLFMSLSFIIVPGLAWSILGEPVSLRFVFGSMIIISGIAIAAS